MRVTTLSRVLLLTSAIAALICASACGGGGGGTSNTPPPVTQPAGPSLQIVTEAVLPGAVQGRAYSATLSAQNAQGTLRWSSARLAGTGLSVDSTTGVISGTASFQGQFQFSVTATDGANHSATKNFLLISFPPLSVQPTANLQTPRFVQPPSFLGIFGGVLPLKTRIVSGSLPPGLRIDTIGSLIGGALATGTFTANVEISDSFTPAEVATQQLTITVGEAPLVLGPSLPARLPLNVAFAGRVVAAGGTPPYTFSAQGALPTGLTGVDPSTGQVSGTPTAQGQFPFTVTVTDSATPPQSTSSFFSITVDPAHGRNDSPATATSFTPGSIIIGSISPYIDPPDKAPTPGDSDYYKVVSLAGAHVQVDVTANQGLSAAVLDPVLEIVDANGHQFSTCNPPNGQTGNFTSICLNDDIIAGVNTNSTLFFQVPGTPGTQTTFYLHVLDFRGDARPDMQYTVSVTGVVTPLAFQGTSLPAATVGRFYGIGPFVQGGTPPYTFTLTGGSLPAGLSLQSSGNLNGQPTTAGTFPFTLQVTDSGTPQQTITGPLTIEVVNPLTITSPAALPDACVNQPYTFQVVTAGGKAPIKFFFQPSIGWPQTLTIDSAGLISGTPTAVGTASAFLSVQDSAVSISGASQNITLNLKTCP